MSRFSDIPRRLIARTTPFQIVYMMVFAVYGTIANLYAGPFPRVTSYIYLFLSIGSLIVLLPSFRRALFRQNDPLRTRRLTGKPAALIGWRLYLYVLVPSCFVILLETFSGLIGALIHFGQSNVAQNPSAVDYITPFLAGTEELWRWSMIGTVVWLLHRVCLSKWDQPSIRVFAFTVALVASSVSFGAGHILEFQTDRLAALLLFSCLGAMLAFMTIVTGRLVLVVCVHVAYDLWVTLLSSIQGHVELIGICVYAALFVAPLVTLLWRKAIFSSIPVVHEPVCLTRCHAGWSQAYEDELKQLRRVFTRRKVCNFEHIGSTAVAGMIANDVVDIQIGLTSLRLKSRERRILDYLGYEVCGSIGMRGRILLAKRGAQPVHLHVVEAFGPLAHANLTLLSYLRSHPPAAEMYCQVKRDIVEHKQMEYMEYTLQKAPFMERLLTEAYE